MTHGFALAAGIQAPEEVLAPLRAYVAGHATGDAVHIAAAFLPTAHVEGYREGSFVSWTLETYGGLFGGSPAADEAGRTRTLDQLTVTGEVATATMSLVHGPDTFTDAFVLVYDPELGWRIVNKVYERRAPAAR
ncbi:MAG: nuclear transport factor 2 family protein [Marmoricola sp.]